MRKKMYLSCWVSCNSDRWLRGLGRDAVMQCVVLISARLGVSFVLSDIMCLPFMGAGFLTECFLVFRMLFLISLTPYGG